MMRRLSLGVPIVLVLASTSPTGSFNLVTDVVAQAPSPQSPQSREQSPSNMQDMMKMHEQMMAEMIVRLATVEDAWRCPSPFHAGFSLGF